MKNRIRLTESDLNRIVKESVRKVITENEEDEGMWNQLKQGAKSFFGNSQYGKKNPNNFRNTVANRQDRGEHTANALNGSTPMNLKGRWNAAKTGYQQQGNIDNANEITNTLKDLIGQGVITQDMTVKQVLGKMTGNRLTAQNKISKANNNIYKGMGNGVMGSGRYERI